ncbi:MAG: hypothetical protein JRI68_25760 [Deltaproteobacteria bacterium]|nr:hypothetical protein [Deltaproteobacteria bacterium]
MTTTHDRQVASRAPRGSLLGKRERALVTAVADAFFPPAGPIPRSGIEAGIPTYFDGYLERAEPLQRTMIRLLIAFLELGPLAFGPRRLPFTLLSRDERIQALEGMFVSRIYFRRVAFTSIRALMTMAYLANGEVAARIGMQFDLDPFDLGPAPSDGDALHLASSGTRVKVDLPGETTDATSGREVS